jgi:hypothetical protein
MNPEDKRDEREAKITALLLGELPTAEAAELTAAIEADADLRRVRDRLLSTMDMVREATGEAAAAWALPVQPRLSESRRSDLLRRFRTVELRSGGRKQAWRSMATLGAAAGLTLVLSVLSLSGGRVMQSDSYAALARKYAETRRVESLRESAGTDRYLAEADGVRDGSEQSPPGQQGKPIAGRLPRERFGTVADQPTSFGLEQAGYNSANSADIDAAAAPAIPGQMHSVPFSPESARPLSAPAPVGLLSEPAGRLTSAREVEGLEEVRKGVPAYRARPEQPPSRMAEGKVLESIAQTGSSGGVGGGGWGCGAGDDRANGTSETVGKV